MVEDDFHAHVFDALYLAVQNITGQAVLGYPEVHHAAGHGTRLVDLDAMAEPCQMVGGGQAARSGAYDQDTFVGRAGIYTKPPAFLQSLVAEEAFDCMDAHRGIEFGAVAIIFTGVVTHAAVYGGHRVILHQGAPRFLEMTFFGVGQPRLNVFAGGARLVAGREEVHVHGPVGPTGAGKLLVLQIRGPSHIMPFCSHRFLRHCLGVPSDIIPATAPRGRRMRRAFALQYSKRMAGPPPAVQHGAIYAPAVMSTEDTDGGPAFAAGRR